MWKTGDDNIAALEQNLDELVLSIRLRCAQATPFLKRRGRQDICLSLAIAHGAMLDRQQEIAGWHSRAKAQPSIVKYEQARTAETRDSNTRKRDWPK